MFIGDLLIGHGLVSADDVAAALKLQRVQAGSLMDCLVRVAGVDRALMAAAVESAPKPPRSVAETGLTLRDLLSLMLKTVLAEGEATTSLLTELMRLPQTPIDEVLREANARHLLLVRPPTREDGPSELRYGLTEKGMQWAQDEMRQNPYVGPAPVPLVAFSERVRRQAIRGERIGRDDIERAFGDMVLSDGLIREIGPAINSGRAMLLYGATGNGKTSIGERLGGVFSDIIFLPHCFAVDGQIVRVFDPGLHRRIDSQSENQAFRREDTDRRWVACRRPFIVTGGELTLEMLDLRFTTPANVYEAPLHIKALGGVFLIDDFGRQLVSPADLLNRWIVPLENGIEYLKLHTGKTFSLPFDEIVIFSTNLSPRRLMDPAFLRRIPYKIHIAPPTAEEYRRIFNHAAHRAGVVVDPELVEEIMVEVRDRQGLGLAAFQPGFIMQQAVAQARFEGGPPTFSPARIAMALNNLVTQEEWDVEPQADVSHAE